MKCALLDLRWAYIYYETVLKNSAADCSVPSRISPDAITSVANSTRPLFDCDDDDDDDSSVDRLVIDIKEDDSEDFNDDHQSIASDASSVDFGVCDNSDKSPVPLVNYLLTLNHSASCMFILV